jgi:hypothetical protein
MTTTAYTFYEKTIIDNIDLSDYEVADNAELFDKVKKLHQVFLDEYGHMVSRVGERNAFKEWLDGLPSILTVPFYYNEIIKNYNDFTGKEMHEKSEETFCKTYFENLANAFFTLKDNL